MSHAVWKISAPISDQIRLNLPLRAKVVHIGDQDGDGRYLTFWFTCDPSRMEDETAKLGQHAREEHRYLVFGTGHLFDPKDVGEHQATVITAGGQLVWHVFSAPWGRK